MIASYLGWSVHGSLASMMVDGALVQVPLEPCDQGARLEGWWSRPEELPREPVCVMGICLWDARWQVAFKHEHHNLVFKRSLGVPSERADAAKRFRQGHSEWGDAEFCHFLVGSGLGEYHRNLLAWQAAKLKEIQPERILYHVPRLEYYDFIRRACSDMGAGSMEGVLREALEQHIQEVLGLQRELFGPELLSRITFVEPLTQGATKVDKSWPFPYLRPEVYGADASQLVGVEDLVEMRILRSVEMQTGRRVPTRLAILGATHPYASKDGEQLTLNRV